MYDILFLSRTIPNEMDAEVREKMSNTMDDAAIAWQAHIIEGIEAELGVPVKMLNYLPVKSYPHNYKDAFVKQSRFSHSDGAEDINLGFCNVKYIKRLLQGKTLYKEVKKWARVRTASPKIIIAYTLYPEYLKAIEKAKKIDPSIRSLAIVLDLPQYSVLADKMSMYTKLYLSWSKRESQKRIDKIDNFVLLTAQMADALGIDKSRCSIVEGICTEKFPNVNKSNDSIKRIFYAGTLHKRFGILRLLDAFSQIKEEDYRLIICGYGDSVDTIREAAEKDRRIEFKGQLHREAALNLMMQSSVIVNPRGNDEIFTRYSFPSKNIEALSSGIPFVAYKLDGISDEYDEYINYPIDDSIGALAYTLKTVCENADNTYMLRAESARDWVVKNKNPRNQARKLLELIESSINDIKNQ